MMTPGQLKQWRARNGYSQQKLADALDVTRVTVTRWETNTREIPSFLHLALEALEHREVEKTRDNGEKEDATNGNDLSSR